MRFLFVFFSEWNTVSYAESTVSVFGQDMCHPLYRNIEQNNIT